MIPQPCDSAAHTASSPPPPGTVAAPDGAEDADFSLPVLLRLRAAVPAEHALLSGEGIQQVQGGTGESEDAFTAALSCWWRQQSLETSGCVSAPELSCERMRDCLLCKKVTLSYIIFILFYSPPHLHPTHTVRSRRLHLESARSRCLQFEMTIPVYIAWYGKSYARQ